MCSLFCFEGQCEAIPLVKMPEKVAVEGFSGFEGTHEEDIVMKAKTLIKSGLTSLCIFFTSQGIAMSKVPTKFDWLATESAPSHYPMEIIQGEFFYHGQGGSRYIPSGGTLRAGWGNFISTHLGGDELYPLPDKVKVIFFSFTENQFYQGEFNLPYEKMVNTFREGIAANKEFPLYSRVMIGVAPGGSVAVWLAGSKTTEMFFGQAEKIDLRYGKVLGLKFSNREEEDAFIYRQLVDVLKPEELESLEKNGVPFGLWSRYRKEYLWNFKSGNDVNFREGLMGIRYLKGDSDRVIYPFEPGFIKTPRPLPRRMPIKPQFTSKNTNFCSGQVILATV